jgi:uncharacterized membrane protein
MTAAAEEKAPATCPDWLPSFFLLVVGIVFGVSLVFLTPPFGVPDELAHYLRAYHCSQGKVYAEKRNDAVGAVLPISLARVYTAIASEPLKDRELHISRQKLAEVARIPLDRGQTGFSSFANTALYSPVPYLPAAVAIRIGRLIHLTPLWLLYAGRVAMLIAYLVVVAGAVYLMPLQKWTMVLLGLMPMSMFLAASLSADTMTTALAYLAIGLLLHLILKAEKATLGQLLLLVSALVLLALAKQAYFGVAFLFLLVPRDKFSSSRQRWLATAGVIGLTLAANVAWAVSVRPLYVPIRPCVDPPGQVHWMLAHPLIYAKDVWYTIADSYRYSCVPGVLGWGTVFLPRSAYTIYWAALVATAVLDGSRPAPPLTIQTRAFSFCAYAAVLALATTCVYVTWHAVGDHYIHGVQARYFQPVLPLLLLPLRAPARWASSRFSRFLVPTGAIFISLLGLVLTWRAMVVHYY